MDVAQLFFQRYDALYQFWLGGLWEKVPDELMRRRPHPRVNPIVWNLWHIARVEDAGLNRFVVDRPQVLDEGRWINHLNVPYRHHGTGMTSLEVDELSQRIDLQALHGYSDAVQARTRDIVTHINQESLGEVLQTERLRSILFDEGLAHPEAAGLLENYTGLTKGKCLMNFGLTHSYQHVGTIEVVARLLGLEF